MTDPPGRLSFGRRRAPPEERPAAAFPGWAPACRLHFGSQPTRNRGTLPTRTTGSSGGLRLSASLPGVVYWSTFEVPVFRTASSDRPLTQEEARSTPSSVTQANYRQSADSKIRVSTNARGTELVFPGARNLEAALGITIFTGVWLVIIWFLIRLHAPMVFPIVFGGFGLLLVYATLELWLRVSQVVANQDGVVISSGYISATRERRISASEIAEVGLSIGMQAGSRPYYDVFLRRKDGKKLTAGHAVRDKREAEWLAATIRSALRLSHS
jgi:hypothetical protein